MKPTRRFPENTRVFVTHGVPSRSRNRRLGASYEAAQKKRATAHSFGRPPDLDPWGRGTNRVIEMCRKAGIAPPIFQENGPFAVVTFQVRGARPRKSGPKMRPKSGLSRDQVKSYGSAAGKGPWLN
jgi:ATP-dependent DNA helicase RecG